MKKVSSGESESAEGMFERTDGDGWVWARMHTLLITPSREGGSRARQFYADPSSCSAENAVPQPPHTLLQQDSKGGPKSRWSNKGVHRGKSPSKPTKVNTRFYFILTTIMSSMKRVRTLELDEKMSGRNKQDTPYNLGLSKQLKLVRERKELEAQIRFRLQLNEQY